MKPFGRSRICSTLLLLLLTGAPAAASEPVAGSPERAAILGALKPSVVADLSGPVGFRVSRLDVEGDWAYVSAIPTRGRDPLDWSRTRFAEPFARDMMSNMVLALLRREADGAWRVVEYALGPTDATWEEWIGKHGLPRALFVPADPATGERDPDGAPIEAAEETGVPVAPTAPGPTSAEDVEKALDAALDAKPPAADPGTAAPPSEPSAPAVAPPVSTPVKPSSELSSLLPEPRSRWRVPAGNTGRELLTAPDSPVVARNGADGATRPGATRDAAFELSTRTRIDQVMTYHYGARRKPGTIALRHEDGTVHGPWPAAGAIGQGGVVHAYWWVRPDITVKAGRYTVIDSDPPTWSREAATEGAGIFQIWGRPAP